MATVKPFEYHVLFHLGRKRWEVHYALKEIGYPAWDKRAALSFAKAEAKKNLPSPSVVIIHVKGTSEVEKTLEYN
jgi:hypothetical protein